ncbi:MAG: type I glyceraldehyde-3-phosphate dehydrogenase [Planctomycetota bacterium]
MAIKVGINGFGRIGRLVYRIAANTPGVEIVGVNDLVPADNLAYLLKYDTMHGRFLVDHKPAEVSATEDSFTVNGKTTACTAIKDPATLPWKDQGVDYVLESTGLFTKGEDAAKHIEAGAKRVVISAPTKTPDTVKTMAYKVNHETYDAASDKVISNASCTTNCLAPIAKVINDEFGLAEGLMTTIHAATATQPTQDGPSKKDWRGGRNAYMNIIPASTGAAKAVGLCIPAVKGKLTGMAFRVPTADVSCVDLTFRTEKPTSLDAINAAMKAAAEGPMSGVLGYTEEQVVSADFVGDPHSSIYDAKAGIQLSETFFKVVSWYDNEAGYAHRCVDMLRMMAEKDGVS